TMSSPAASCALMIAATASRYCSRNSESSKAALKERPSRLRSNHNGRGYDPVIAVGRIMSRVVFSIAPPHSAGHPRGSGGPEPQAMCWLLWIPAFAGMTRVWPSMAVEDRLRQQCRDDIIRHIDDIRDAQIDRNRADHIGLLAAEPALPQ